VQLLHAGQCVGNPLASEHVATFVHDAHVVVDLGPIHSNKNHVVTPFVVYEPRGDGGDLMDQCSKHDTPPAFSAVLTNRSGHVLRLELDAQIVVVLTDQRFGVIFSKDDDGHH
jgi:hypothetical protein